MSALVLLIKNMVCNRCILAVENILTSESISFQKITIGQVELTNELTQSHKIQMVSRLREIGFELIDNRSTALIERVKQLVISKSRNDLNTLEPKVKLSLYISTNVNHEYTYISSLFSSVEGRTIENYFIEHRIEKVKELLTYDKLTLEQIAFDLDYSNAAHLSNQFKKFTGLTPSHFKRIGSRRKSLDEV